MPRPMRATKTLSHTTFSLRYHIVLTNMHLQACINAVKLARMHESFATVS